MIFESHAHYDADWFDADRDELLSSLPAAGIGWVVNPGCDLESSRTAVRLAETHPHVYAGVGFHPENCADCNPDQLDQIRALAVGHRDRVVAIGEIGLDYYWPDAPSREHQQRCFRDQLALARELDLPVIVHAREAMHDSVAIVREFPDVRGVFHCYSGSVEDARLLVHMGWMISFTGVVTYKNARKAPEVVAALPLDRIMIETDSPYLSPVPVRGKRNDSRNLVYIRDRIAEIRGISPEEVERATTENALRFFRIPR